MMTTFSSSFFSSIHYFHMDSGLDPGLSLANRTASNGAAFEEFGLGFRGEGGVQSVMIPVWDGLVGGALDGGCGMA
jgi:hypothetical protein